MSDIFLMLHPCPSSINNSRQNYTAVARSRANGEYLTRHRTDGGQKMEKRTRGQQDKRTTGQQVKRTRCQDVIIAGREDQYAKLIDN